MVTVLYQWVYFHRGAHPSMTLPPLVSCGLCLVSHIPFSPSQTVRVQVSHWLLQDYTCSTRTGQTTPAHTNAVLDFVSFSESREKIEYEISQKFMSKGRMLNVALTIPLKIVAKFQPPRVINHIE